MKRTIHQLVPGTPDWHAHRSRCYNASEAAAIFGQHKYLSREELMRRMHTGVTPDVDHHTQRLFDAGHRVEKYARTAVQELVGEDLYPITASVEIDGLLLSASYDGITMGEDVIFECKLWNQELAERVMARDLAPHYYWQLEQQLLIVGAERTIFAIAEDKPDGQVLTMEYRPVAGRREALISGWQRFHEDRKVYVPAPVVEKVKAEPVESLPAIAATVTGELVVSSNVKEWAAQAKAFIEKIPTKPATDQEFANCEAAAKALREAEKRITVAKEGAIGQVASVASLMSALDDIFKLVNRAAIDTENRVKERKREMKEAEVQRGRKALEAFVAEANKGFPTPLIPMPEHDFPNAIKGLSSIDSVRNNIDTHLSDCKTEVLTQTTMVVTNLLCMTSTFGEDKALGKLLMPDLKAMVLKPCEDFANLVATRHAEHKVAEQARKDREARAAEEAAEHQRKLDEAAAAAPAPTPAPSPAPVVNPLAAEDRTPQDYANAASLRSAPEPDMFAAPAPTMPPAMAAAMPATLNLGSMCDRLGFVMNSAFVSQLGIEPAAVEKAAKKYTEAQFALICESLVAHVRTVQAKHRVGS